MIRLALGLALLGPASAPAGMPLSCDLGPAGAPQVVTVTRTNAIVGSHVYHLRQGQAPRRPLFDGEAEDSRGMAVRIGCAGRSRRALALMGEFMSAGYPRGMVMVYDPDRKRFLRFHFAERNAPRWLYLGRKDALLVFPPGGRMETARHYLVYRFTAAGKQDSPEELERARPSGRGYEVIDLRF